jgi:hypothetical protein
LSVDVETCPNKLGAEINPAVWKATTVEINEAVLIYVRPRPVTVDCKVLFSRLVDTRPNKLGAEINPAVWRARTVDISDAVLIYVRPRPVTVDCKVVFRRVVDTRPNKLGAEINPAVWYPDCRDLAVDMSEAVDTYPAEPNPATVEVILSVS